MAKGKVSQPAAAYPSRSTTLLERIHNSGTVANGSSQIAGSEVKLQIVIVGAGLGGLATAVALARQGHEVTVLEQAAALGEVGAGIQIPPNSSRLLQKWGLGPYLKEYAVKPESMTFRRWENGDAIGYTSLCPEFETRYGAPYLVIHRADFHSALCRRAKELGVKVITDSRVTAYDETVPSASTSDGRKYQADLIIAADGVKSIARSVVLGGTDQPPQRTGFAAYRATVNTEEMKRDEDTAWLLEKPGINIWIGEDRHVMTYCIAGGDSFNMVLSHVDHSCPSTWNAETAINDMRESFKDWDSKLFKVIQMIKSTIKWPLMSGSHLQTWISRSQKLLILGDAAHAMVPYMSQGAAMAVEDGAALAAAISKIKHKDQLTTALRIFEKERMSRSYGMQFASLVNGRLWHFPDGPLQQARDLGMRPEVEGKPFVESTNQWSDPVTQIWAYGYDAEDAIGELSHAQDVQL
ncbi:salicylate hydroxylase [Fusarium beomiforme]|uniref:Salicylate hydroxylase n=1 Tax=Fusarium beomiforme TaxID=44412 RepID=A0A9P5AAU2_9HYPO|nr:salicylate hydroxylase [Fusarium beomiforme]